MISTWNIKKFSRSKVPLAQSTIPVSNTWNHFLDENLNVIFLLNNVINDNYGTLRVVQKSYQNVIVIIVYFFFFNNNIYNSFKIFFTFFIYKN